MEIKYIHDINKNYMIVKCEKNEEKNFKTKMLQDNNIEGLLKLKQKYLDLEERLYYDISSKQSMEVLYEKGHIQIADLKQVIFELEACVNVLEKYLLDFNDIILNPKMIFIDIKTLKYSFCYYPYYEGDFREELAGYLNYVITKIDHSDIAALNLAYDLQKITQKENYVIGDLLELIKEPEIINENTPEEMPKEIPEEELEISYKIPYINKKIKLPDSFLEKATIAIFAAGILLWVYIFIKTENENLRKIIMIIIPAIILYIGYLFLKKKKEKITVEEVPLKEKVVEEEPLFEDSLTVYLGSSDESTNRYLKSFDDPNQDLKIESIPAIIGKMESKADLIIKNNLISRMHAKLYLDNKHYYIEDLNSTNGTFVNGERVGPYEKRLLAPGDIIKFSELAYKFV